MKKREKTVVSRLAGKLVKELDRAWVNSLDTDNPERGEEEMNAAHDIQEAEYAGRLTEHLDGRSVVQIIGEEWLVAHPTSLDAARELETAIQSRRTDDALSNRMMSPDTPEPNTQKVRP